MNLLIRLEFEPKRLGYENNGAAVNGGSSVS